MATSLAAIGITALAGTIAFACSGEVDPASRRWSGSPRRSARSSARPSSSACRRARSRSLRRAARRHRRPAAGRDRRARLAARAPRRRRGRAVRRRRRNPLRADARGARPRPGRGAGDLARRDPAHRRRRYLAPGAVRQRALARRALRGLGSLAGVALGAALAVAARGRAARLFAVPAPASRLSSPGGRARDRPSCGHDGAGRALGAAGRRADRRHRRPHPEEDAEIARLVELAAPLLAFKTFAYIQVGKVLGELLFESDVPPRRQTWVERSCATRRTTSGVAREVRAVAEEIAADPTTPRRGRSAPTTRPATASASSPEAARASPGAGIRHAVPRRPS